MKNAFWLTPFEYTQIVETAADIIEREPTSRLFDIGQSPAWIIEAAAMLKRVHSKPFEGGHIPLSSHFLTQRRCDHDGWWFDAKNDETVSACRSKNYLKLLQHLNADPEHIVDCYEKDGQKTVFMDFIAHGRGLASFLYILAHYANKRNVGNNRLIQSLSIFALSSCSAMPQRIDFHLGDLCVVPVQSFYVPNMNLQHTLWNCSTNKRIVPEHPHHKWREAYPVAGGNPKIVADTFRALESAARRYSQLRNDPFRWPDVNKSYSYG